MGSKFYRVGKGSRKLSLCNIENIRVAAIPATNVKPTERIGMIGTIAGAINTENPTTVVAACVDINNARKIQALL